MVTSLRAIAFRNRMSGYRIGMDPIRTAVKYSLIPLRIAVQLGEAFVGSDDDTPPTQTPRAEQPQQGAKTTTARRKPATRKRTTPSPQASQKPKDLDDVGLARKVETVIFRDATVPKGKIDVNAADGVVWLRGEAKTPEMIKELEQQASSIPEVKKVENLLHLPKTPAPTRTDTPPTQRRTRSSTSRPTAARKVETGVTNERLSAHGEDLPVEAAHQGEGRKPAPLGSNGSSS
jgi:BON domain